MSPIARRLLGIVRIGLILILLANAIGPLSVAAHSRNPDSKPVEQNAPNTLPELAPEYALTPTAVAPVRTDPLPDEPESAVPPNLKPN